MLRSFFLVIVLSVIITIDGQPTVEEEESGSCYTRGIQEMIYKEIKEIKTSQNKDREELMEMKNLLQELIHRSPVKYPECRNYTNIYESNRNACFRDESVVLCDNTTIPGWYRFIGEGGSYLPEFIPDKERCGTIATGWLNAEHPTDYKVIVATVCFNYYDICTWETNIKVRHCGDYYVYYLVPHNLCHLRFCTAKNRNGPC